MPDFNRAMENAGFEKKEDAHSHAKYWERIDLVYERYAEDRLKDKDELAEAAEA
jgi:hypothetical protein